MTIAEIIEYVKSSGGYSAPLLLVALIWMEKERKSAVAEAKEANAKLASLSERTLVLFTEIKALVGNK